MSEFVEIRPGHIVRADRIKDVMLLGDEVVHTFTDADDNPHRTHYDDHDEAGEWWEYVVLQLTGLRCPLVNIRHLA